VVTGEAELADRFGRKKFPADFFIAIFRSSVSPRLRYRGGADGAGKTDSAVAVEARRTLNPGLGGALLISDLRHQELN
jgi:hypothetical protein